MIRRLHALCAFGALLFLAVSAVAQSSVDERLAAMTLEQKVGQMFLVTLHGEVLTEAGTAHLRAWQPGGIVLFGSNVGNPAAITRLTNGYQATITEAGGVPLLISVDQEGGVVNRLTEGFTFVPTPLLLTASGMSEEVGALVGAELRAVGITMNLAPVADLETYRSNPIIARRAFGNDPAMVGAAVAAYVRGTQASGTLATAKHFPGHGETREDSHASLPEVDLPRDRLEAVELEPFRQAIEADVAVVMVSHIWFPALDPVRRPASLSPEVVTGLLRGNLGYEGLIMTDAMDMNAVDLEVNYYDAIIMAIQAGADLLAAGPSIGLDGVQTAMQRVIDAVRAGTIPESRIDDSVRRILRAKDRFGLLDWVAIDPRAAEAAVAALNGQAVVEALYQRGATVALDRFDRVPIAADQRVAVIFLATRYQIQAECSLYRTDPALTQWVGVNDNPTSEQIAWARAAANQADTAVVWTQNAYANADQAALVRALPPEKTVAVALWSPYDWLAFPEIGAYMATYSPGRPAVPAACALLFGGVPATGQMPLTLDAIIQAGDSD